MAVLPINYISVFYIEFTINTQSHIKCTYIISREYSHIVLTDHASISCILTSLPTPSTSVFYLPVLYINNLPVVGAQNNKVMLFFY